MFDISENPPQLSGRRGKCYQRGLVPLSYLSVKQEVSCFLCLAKLNSCRLWLHIWRTDSRVVSIFSSDSRQEREQADFPTMSKNPSWKRMGKNHSGKLRKPIDFYWNYVSAMADVFTCFNKSVSSCCQPCNFCSPGSKGPGLVWLLMNSLLHLLSQLYSRSFTLILWMMNPIKTGKIWDQSTIKIVGN